MPELIIHEKTGFLVKSVNEATDALKDVKKIDRRHCREQSESNFSREKMIEDYLILLGLYYLLLIQFL